MLTKNLLKLAIFLFVLVFFLLNIYLRSSKSMNDSNQELLANTCNPIEWINEFYSIALKYGTDKISDHRYDYIYGSYLGPLRHKRIDLLEIGLGCTMTYGPGRSLSTWREFLPLARITILEYDRHCAEKFRSEVEQLFIGDQADFELLDKVAQNGPYNVIIDDGGHTNRQQVG